MCSRNHVGMGVACTEIDLPKELRGRFLVMQLGAVCKHGVHFISGYLHSGMTGGIKHRRNLDWLQAAAGVLRTLRGPWIMACDWNSTAEQLKRDWLASIGWRRCCVS